MICIDECDRISELYRELVIDWQEAGRLYTKDYWTVQYYLDNSPEESYRLGSTLMEEVVACLLGGYGLKAEIGLLAFHRLKNMDLIHFGTDMEVIENAITRPYVVSGRKVHYRFPHQKAKYIYEFLQRQDVDDWRSLSGYQLRSMLLTVRGIGPKTASWIARNYTNSDDVAIVDIHIYRAGRLAGFIDPEWDVRKDYYKIEESFLDFCDSIDASPSRMDSIMWNQMKISSRRALRLLNQKIV